MDGLAYLASAWVLLQLVDVLGDRWNWPVGTQRLIDVLLVAGFFVMLVLAWYHGEKGRQRVSGPELLMLAALLVAFRQIQNIGSPTYGSAGRNRPWRRK